MNVELAHKLSEQEHHAAHSVRWHGVVETLEVLLLALVAIATAWSGYQAAQWEGHEALLYSNSSAERFDGEAQTITAANLRQEDLTLFSGWLQAQSDGDTALAAAYIRRMRPDYRVAFDAWLKTDPLNSPQAPPSPSFMPEYRNAAADEATRLEAQSRVTFAEGTEARHTADDYVRNTILFATVLFLVAVAQRFKTHWVRVVTNLIALVLLVGALASIVVLPRL